MPKRKQHRKGKPQPNTAQVNAWLVETFDALLSKFGLGDTLGEWFDNYNDRTPAYCAEYMYDAIMYSVHNQPDCPYCGDDDCRYCGSTARPVMVATCGTGEARCYCWASSPTLGQLGEVLAEWFDNTAVDSAGFARLALRLAHDGDISLWLGASEGNHWELAELVEPTAPRAGMVAKLQPKRP